MQARGTVTTDVISRPAWFDRKFALDLPLFDHAFFVAEPDDHHFARITELIRRFT